LLVSLIVSISSGTNPICLIHFDEVNKPESLATPQSQVDKPENVNHFINRSLAS